MMEQEERQRAATRELQIEDEDGLTQLIIRVSGNEVEFTRGQQLPWDNEDGTGNDEAWETWTMDLDTLKRFIQAANWCLEKSEAFEKSHPAKIARRTSLRTCEAPADDPGYFIL